ncbi:MAG TPA: hypothetical protein VE570_00615 [Thermoleophilaceae bacterium]|jgi:hypothetical protein|nr:hypothetical protein [Thermoleophilaceae bacterium]
MDGAQNRSAPESADRPDPETALGGSAARTPDHEPSDSDDRVVELDEPEATDPPVDDEDRDPAKDPDDSPGTPR